MVRLLVVSLTAALAACGTDRSSGDDAEPLGDAVAQVTVRAYTTPYAIARSPAGPGLTWVVVDVDVRSAGAIGVGFDVFSLETNVASYAAIESSRDLENGCHASLTTVPNQTRFCRVAFRVAQGERPATLYLRVASAIVFDDFEGIGGPPMPCATIGPESTQASCSDGCNNDGDAYVDCGDADCCGVVVCARDTYCGRNAPTCVPGPEAALSTCIDQCDNDEDGGGDCNDADCCDLLACSGDALCASAPNPFEGGIFIDDEAVRRIDPTKLEAGPAPCRAPTLVEIDRVSDGDTVTAYSIDGGGIAGPVRLIGVDTPERARDGMPEDCYASEATTFSRRLAGRLAWLTFDAECKDQYDRTLAFLHVGEHRSMLWQRQLLRRGLARVYTVRDNDGLAPLFEHDAAIAADARVGLYGACP